MTPFFCLNMTSKTSKFNTLMHAFKSVPFTPSDFIFDYDSTIARVPIDWPAARPKFRAYLNSLVPDIELPDGLRVDEMEAAVLQQTNLEPTLVFQYREQLESSLRGAHEPIQEVVDLIRMLQGQSDVRLFIVSNNLEGTVRDGLTQLDLLESFTHIYGVDTVGLPKPYTKAADLLNEEYQVDLRKAVFFGDSPPTDGLFCEKLGIHFINIKNI